MASYNPDNEIRLVLLGKTGAGKSSLGNSLLKKQCYETSATGTSVTTVCQYAQTTLADGTILCVVDTPGLFDTRRSNKDTTKEIIRCIGLSSPGPHIFFLVLRIGRFTEEELATVNHLVAIFGEEVINFVVVVFTGKDSLDHDNKALSEYLREVPDALKLILKRCRSRCVAINNRGSQDEIAGDAEGIMAVVRRTIQDNEGRYYTGEMYEAAEKKMREREMEVEEERRRKQMELERRYEQLEGQSSHDVEQQRQEVQAALISLREGNSRQEVRENVANFNDVLITLIQTIGPIIEKIVDKIPAAIIGKQCVIS